MFQPRSLLARLWRKSSASLFSISGEKIAQKKRNKEGAISKHTFRAFFQLFSAGLSDVGNLLLSSAP
jgi:hypothetical protein